MRASKLGLDDLTEDVTVNLEPSTLNPQNKFPDSKFKILHPKRWMAGGEAHTLHSKPSILNTKHHTPNPKPETLDGWGGRTLNPKP